MTRKMLVLALSAAALATSAFAGEIYKYVDDDGTVHYLDRPTGESGEERLELTYSRTSNEAVNARIQKRREYMAALDDASNEAQSRREAQAQARTEVEERAAKCAEHRARLETYLQSRRLYRENAAGEREYLDEEQIMEARRKVEEAIQETCS